MRVLLHQYDIFASLGEQRPDGRTGRAASDDQYVEVIVCHCADVPSVSVPFMPRPMRRWRGRSRSPRVLDPCTRLGDSTTGTRGFTDIASRFRDTACPQPRSPDAHHSNLGLSRSMVPTASSRIRARHRRQGREACPLAARRDRMDRFRGGLARLDDVGRCSGHDDSGNRRAAKSVPRSRSTR